MRRFSGWLKRTSVSPFSQAPVFVHRVDSGSFSGDAAFPERSSGNRMLPLRKQIAIAMLAVALSVGMGSAANWQLLHLPGARPVGGMAAEWQPSSIAVLNGVNTFRVDPGGPMSAGTRSVLILTLFQEALPAGTSQIDVTATHWLGGKPIVLAKGLHVADATFSTRYDEVQAARIGVPFGLPLAGPWRIDVKLDGRPFGHAVVDVPDFPWVPSVRKPLVEQDGWLDRTIALEGPAFAAHTTSSYTWYLLTRGSISGTFRVEAVKRGSTKRRVLFETDQFEGPKYGASASIPSKLSLPSPGIWRITAYVNGIAFGSFVVEAN